MDLGFLLRATEHIRALAIVTGCGLTSSPVSSFGHYVKGIVCPKEGYKDDKGSRGKAIQGAVEVTWLVQPGEEETEGRPDHILQLPHEGKWRDRVYVEISPLSGDTPQNYSSRLNERDLPKVISTEIQKEVKRMGKPGNGKHRLSKMPTSSVIVAFQSIADKSSLLRERFNTVPNLPLTLALKGYFGLTTPLPECTDKLSYCPEDSLDSYSTNNGLPDVPQTPTEEAGFQAEHGQADSLGFNFTVDLDRLEIWVHKNLVKSDKEKCKVLHLKRSNPMHQYMLGEDGLEISFSETNLGFLVDNGLNVSKQHALEAKKANSVLLH
ncbi:hypothetical protein BTVI_133435 [Pitangus sulphuratus]|nr:hypothetical protein BTVI_133435 [Pitangus sulphuratus]